MALSRVFADITIGVRSLCRTPVFTMSAILVLGVGVGVGTAAFNVINAVWWQPVAAGRPFVRVVAATASGHETGLDEDEIVRLLADPPRSLSVAAAHGGSRARTGAITAIVDGVSRRVAIEGVTSGYFDVFGARPAAGRLFAPREDAASPVAVISERWWQTVFARSPDAVGRSMIVAGEMITIIGVAAAPFRGVPSGTTDIWVLSPLVRPNALFGRLASSATIEQLNAELRIREATPDGAAAGGRRFEARPGLVAAQPRGVVISAAFGSTGILLAGLVVSGVAAASLALMLFARLAANQASLALRLALGATTGDLTRLVAAELALMAAAGAWVALAVGGRVSGLMTRAFAEASSVPLALDTTPDWRVVLYVIGITVLVWAVLISHVRWTIVRFDALGSMAAAGGLGGATLRTAGTATRLIVTQTAVTTALLLVAVLLARSALFALDPIHRAEGRHSVLVWLDQTAHRGSLSAGAEAARRVLDTVQAMPGITHVAVVSRVPGMPGWSAPAAPDGALRRHTVNPLYVTEDVFGSLDLPIVRGRTFTPAETFGAEVAIVSERVASMFWPGTDPLHRHLTFLTPDGASRPFLVVGVATDVQTGEWEHRPPDDVYLPLGHRKEPGGLAIIVRAGEDAPHLARRLRHHLQQTMPRTGLLAVRTVSEELGMATGGLAFMSRLLGILGLSALSIALAGLYGLTAYLATQRRREMAIRHALGATHWRLCAMIAGESGRVLGAGIAAGVLIGIGAASFVARWLPALTLFDTAAVIGVAGLLLLTGLFGSMLPFLPALRAADTALREM